MRDSIRAGDMPPWPARVDVNDFAGARKLTDKELSLFEKWIDEGMPKGDPSDEPPKVDFPKNWTARKSGMILDAKNDYLTDYNVKMISEL